MGISQISKVAHGRIVNKHMSLEERDRELILGIARKQGDLELRVKKIEESKTGINFPITPSLGITPVKTKIVHETNDRKVQYKLDVQFKNSESIPPEERMVMSEVFFSELRSLLHDHSIIKLEGFYVAAPESI